jgi:transcriptional regulator with GAF, ATPase, and Fis domain
LSNQLVRLAPLVLLPIFAVVSTVLAVVDDGRVRVYWALVAGIATAGTAVLMVAKDRRARAAELAALTARTAVVDRVGAVGQPLLAALGDVALASDPHQRRAALDVLIAMVVDHAVSECGRGNVRSVYYELSGNRLERRRFGGRGENVPRKEFVAGSSEHDNEVLKLARSGQPVLVEDLENAPPPYFIDNLGRSYRSFVACPIRIGETSFGMLGVDSEIASGFTGVDQVQLSLLAGVLAAGLACRAFSSI